MSIFVRNLGVCLVAPSYSEPDSLHLSQCNLVFCPVFAGEFQSGGKYFRCPQIPAAMASTPSPSVPWTGPSKVLQPVE
jgi:hypothetical protein